MTFFRNLCCCFILLLNFQLAAQTDQPNGRTPEGEQRTERFIERIERARDAFLTEELQLSEQEAEAFLPVYRSYSKKLRQFRMDNVMERLDRRRDSEASDTPLSEQDALAALQRKRALRAELSQLRQEAEAAYLRVLPARKVLQIDAAERAFRSHLLELRTQRNANRNRGERAGRPGDRRERNRQD